MECMWVNHMLTLLWVQQLHVSLLSPHRFSPAIPHMLLDCLWPSGSSVLDCVFRLFCCQTDSISMFVCFLLSLSLWACLLVSVDVVFWASVIQRAAAGPVLPPKNIKTAPKLASFVCAVKIQVLYQSKPWKIAAKQNLFLGTVMLNIKQDLYK